MYRINDFCIETSSYRESYSSYVGQFRRHNEEHVRLFAHRTVPVPATRAARREINETRRQLYLQPLQPMLFQRIIDLSSDSSRSYANSCFHVRVDRCACIGSSYAVAKLSSCKIVQFLHMTMNMRTISTSARKIIDRLERDKLTINILHTEILISVQSNITSEKLYKLIRLILSLWRFIIALFIVRLLCIKSCNRRRWIYVL